jgi:hypothetical protein
MQSIEEIKALHVELLKNIKAQLPKLKELLASVNDHWNYEDAVYRFYHHSFKVYHIQTTTVKIVGALADLLPGHTFNDNFRTIFIAGAGKKFKHEHNRNWSGHTRPMLEAFWHAKFMLEMAVKYGEELTEPPSPLPSGWAALLYLFNLR